ncbi:MAG: exodeoxyribonuclease VII small subunit [Candidatus Syntrophosphaera sp.]
MNKARESKTPSFEKALVKLEEIVERMSSEQLNLDQMIALYEEGIGYLSICQKQLADAEAKITILNDKIKQSGKSEDENG